MKNFQPVFGLDKIILSTVNDIKFDVDFLIRYSCSSNQKIIIIDNLTATNNPPLTQTMDGKDVYSIKIIDNNLFSDLTIYAISVGYQQQKICAKLSLSVALYRQDSNLIPLSYGEYDIYIKKVLFYLVDKYHIYLDYNHLRIHYMELNATIAVEEAFHEYDRVFRLLMSFFPNTLSDLKLHPGKTRQTYNSYLRDCKSYSIIIYNKNEQLQEIKKQPSDLMDTTIIRLEYKCHQDKIKSIFKSKTDCSRFWSAANDSELIDFFQKELSRLEKVYDNWRKERNKEIIKNIKTMSQLHPNDYHHRIIQFYLNGELQQKIPLILDLQQIFATFPSLKTSAFQKNRARTRKSFLRCCVDSNVFLEDHTKKMQEIFDSLRLAIDNFSNI